MRTSRWHFVVGLSSFLYCFAAIAALSPAFASADDTITVEQLDTLDEGDFNADDWKKLQREKTRVKKTQDRLDGVDDKGGAEAGILNRRIKESKKRIAGILEKNNVTLGDAKPTGAKPGAGGGGNKPAAAAAAKTTSLPLLVNLQGFADADALADVKKRVGKNVEDANKVLADNAKKLGKETGLSLGPVQFKHNPRAATELKQGTKEFRQMQQDGVKEVDKAFGKNKGSKLFIVPVLRLADNSVPSGLGTTPGRTAFFPDGLLDSEKEDETKQTFGVQRRRGLGDDFIETAPYGHFLVHELLHNAGLGSADHQEGTIFAETLDFGPFGERKGHRTINAGQWGRLETFFQTYGNPPQENKTTDDQSSLFSEPGDTRYAAVPDTSPANPLASAWGGTALNIDTDGLYHSGDGTFLPDGSLTLAPEAGAAFTNSPMPVSDPLIGLSSDVLNTTPAFSASRAPGIQLMIIMVLRFRAPGSPVASVPPDRLVRGSMTGSNPRRPGIVPASYTLGVGPRGLARAQVVRPPRGAPLKATIRALGISSGEAFTVDVANDAAYPIDVSAAGVVVEALTESGGQAVQRAFQSEASGKAMHTGPANGYCLEFLQQPPPAGTVFRVAAPELQETFQPMRSVLRAAQELLDLGDLSPDSDPTQYFHSIVQWSLWSKERGFDMSSFGEAFVDRTKKNFEAANQPWTAQADEAVRGLVANRWSDIERILEEAAFIDLATP